MGPCTASSCCLPGPECVMGPCTASHIAADSSSPDSAMCHFQVSLHCWPVYGLQLKLLLLRHSAIGLLIVVSPRCCWGDFLT
ncbi:unnamed protein product [Staurois parvus]|uniref:Uncharacterized protein n=1 Tax=Staurois parvus TaxID=386267 RepID=A0ABN9D032_9NEOB|nr:unnamed protein product [Staurois parvus]